MHDATISYNNDDSVNTVTRNDHSVADWTILLMVTADALSFVV